MTNICPNCGREFDTKTGLATHMNYINQKGGCVKETFRGPSPILTDAEMTEYAKITGRNILLECEGRPKSLTGNQRKILERQGIITVKHGYGGRKIILTPKAHEILAEVNI